ncbi:MAG: IS66 family transposase, partial [Gammaproteobacteria bacterium]
ARPPAAHTDPVRRQAGFAPRQPSRGSPIPGWELAIAEQGRQEAERARQEAEQARAQLVDELAEVTADRDALSRHQEALWKEKKSLENEVEVLFKRISELTRQLAEATSEELQERFALELKTLQRRLDDRNRTLYGTRSERRGRPEHAEGDDKPARTRRRKRSGSRRTAQPELPIRKVAHRLSPEEQSGGCKLCHGDLDEMKEQVESSEEITVQRVRYEMVVHERQKYRCQDCGGIVTAPGPDKLIVGGRYSPEFVAHSVVAKYVDHMPLERQVRQMRRAGLTITSQALWDQHRYLATLLLPTLMALHALILTSAVCFIDETPWRMMKKGGTKRWWLWALSNGPLVYFQIVPSREAAAARELLRDYSGILMSDDYVVYSSLEKERTRLGGVQQVIDEKGNPVELPTPDYVLATCWMHARRYLYKAERYHPEAGPGLELIAGLYKAEADADADVARQVAAAERAGRELSDDARTELLLDARRHHRARTSRELIDRLDTWRKQLPRLEGSALAEALDHLDRLWSRLVLFLDDPRIPIDNGHSERQVRGPVLGRKNFQGSRSEEGARVSATLYSLVASAINLGLNPEDYLTEASRRALAEPGTVFLPTDYATELAESPSSPDG